MDEIGQLKKELEEQTRFAGERLNQAQVPSGRF